MSIVAMVAITGFRFCCSLAVKVSVMPEVSIVTISMSIVSMVIPWLSRGFSFAIIMVTIMPVTMTIMTVSMVMAVVTMEWLRSSRSLAMVVSIVSMPIVTIMSMSIIEG